MQNSKSIEPALNQLQTLARGRILQLCLAWLILQPLLGTLARGDEYDSLRLRWKATIVGDGTYNPSDPDFSYRINIITNNANSLWSSMIKTGGNGRAYLWSNAQIDRNYSYSSPIVTNFSNLRAMALAYATVGSSLYNNATLCADIIGGLDWMYANAYNTTIESYGNWWDFQIGGPMKLNDTAVLVYDSLTSTQISHYTNATRHYVPNPTNVLPSNTNTAANRVWKTQVVLVRAILQKNDDAELASCSSALSDVFPYAYADGFHLDGSFIQHADSLNGTTPCGGVPYVGGYGKTMLNDLADILYTIQGSSWDVTAPAKANIFNWIGDSYLPFIYKGGCMSMVRGREISRENTQDHDAGHDLMNSMLKWTQIASSSDALAYQQMIKYWAQQDTYTPFINDVDSLYLLPLAKNLMTNTSVVPMSEPVFNHPFPEMDRVVHLRPGFGFGLSMYSSRIYDYESNVSENYHGWYTNFGMTYVYNGDLDQYDNSFWAVVNPYRLPGTTVDTRTFSGSVSPNIMGTQSWVGAADMDDLYGVAGMNLQSPYGSLVAKKSWFMFDDEIVALGSGISSTDPYNVQTIVENRRLNDTGTNSIIINDSTQSTALTWSQTMTLPASSWVYVQGSSTTATPLPSTGFYFPSATTLSAVREQRTGYWSDINSAGNTGSRTRNFATFWLDHGLTPVNATYAYVILPNKTTAQLAAYAAHPDITIIANNTLIQAVRENNLGITGANFWTDTTTTAGIITSDHKACVLTKEVSGQLEVSVADPTQLNSTIHLTIARSALSTLSCDSRIAVTQLSPTVQLTVDTSYGPNPGDGNGIRGHAWKATFGRPDGIIVDNADPTVVATTGTWTLSSSVDGWDGTFLNGGKSMQGGVKSVAFTPNLPALGLYDVYGWWAGVASHDAHVPFTITYSTGTTTYYADQTQPTGTHSWTFLGTYLFNAGTSGGVAISNASTSGYVVADAIRFVPRHRDLLFDFGPSTATTSGNWNNITDSTTLSSIPNVIDNTGASTGIAFSITAPFSSTNANGTTSSSAPYPASATQDSFVVSPGMVAKVKLQNLIPGLPYSFTFYASRIGSAADRVTIYTIGTKTAILDPTNNVTNSVVIPNITPDSNRTIEIQIASSSGTGYAMLGVVDVKW